jgi:sterol desaturase/sphingolipid hydroxylase (fatty acid hydroxylase superfamily)
VSWSVLSPAVIIGAALLFVGLERRFPYDRGQKFLREGFWVDFLAYTLVQSYVLAWIISQIAHAIDRATGASTHGFISGWPIWAQAAFFVVSHDLYIYWFHRWQHYSPTLWRLHEAHHSVGDVDWVAGSRSHPLEILINETIQFSPMILLGAHPDVPLIKGMISAVWGMWIHSNIDAHTGWLQWIINGPEAHRWHHATDHDAYDRNFGTKLAIWDRLFGTTFLPRGRKPAGYGLPNVPMPSGYWRQVLFAFRRERPATTPEGAKAA